MPEVFLLSGIFVISGFFLNMYIFKCIKRSFASDSVNLCAVCAICPGNYLCMVITIATSQVDNVMQITAAPGMGDVNTSMYLHPWSSTFHSDFPFPSPKTCWFKISFPHYDWEAKENLLLCFSLVFTEGGGGWSFNVSVMNNFVCTVEIPQCI